MKTLIKQKLLIVVIFVFYLLPFHSLSQTTGTNESYCETLSKVIKLFKEGKYHALYKVDTEKKADITSLYDIEYEAVYPITLFEKSFILKEKDLNPAVFSVRYYYKSEVDEVSGIYDQLKSCFNEWEFKEESDSYEETNDLITDMVYMWTYTYTKDGVKAMIYIEEASNYSQIELKIDKE